MENKDIPHLINVSIFKDDRGSFSRIDVPDYFGKTKQSNHVINEGKGMIRGLHWQDKPKNEKKIIRVIKGEIYDVLVDVRKKSNTFGKSFNFLLVENGSCLYVPEGFAHGYQTMTNYSEILYLHSENYFSNLSKTLKFDEVNILWPIRLSKISTKDKDGLKLNDL